MLADVHECERAEDGGGGSGSAEKCGRGEAWARGSLEAWKGITARGCAVEGEELSGGALSGDASATALQRWACAGATEEEHRPHCLDS